MIVVALIATLASSMLWQQWRAVQVEAAERERAQSIWILSGALDWARLILREDAKLAEKVDHLGEPWAVPLQEARLSSFLAVDKGETEDAPDAFLSGDITDAQSRYNLGNLIQGGKVVTAELEALQRLCQSAGVSADVANRIANGLRDATPIDPVAAAGSAPVERPANPPLMPRSAQELGWLGVDAESLRTLEPYVVMLPNLTGRPVPVNVNTASREVISASIDGLDLASAERIVQARQRSPLKGRDELKRYTAIDPAKYANAAVESSWFIVRGRLRLGQVVLEQRSLIRRDGLTMTVVQRERVSSRDPNVR